MKNAKSEILPIGFEVKQLVGLSWETLRQLFKQMNGRKLTSEELPRWKLLLGFVNSTTKATKTSMQCFKLVSLPLGIKEMKKAMKIKHK